MQTDTAVPTPFLAALGPARWRRAGGDMWRHRIFYVLIARFAALTLVMGVWPIVLGIIVSFTDSYTALTDAPNYVGFRNYLDIFQDDLFISSLWRTLLFTVLSVVLNVATAPGLALILASKPLKLAAPICGLALFLPVVTPEAATFIVWKWMFSIDFGAVNTFLEDLGLPDFAGTTQLLQAFMTLVFVEWWHHVGFYTIIFLTNLKLLDPTPDEAARIDGANTGQRVWNVWIPQLRPAIAIVVIMTSGGPNYATNFLSFYAYSRFNLADYGQALAMATVLFAIVVGLAVVVYRYNEKADYR